MSADRASRRTQWLYLGAAIAGLCAALTSALGLFTPDPDLGGAVVTVNGAPISKAEFLRASGAMQASLDRQLNAEDRERALDVLIKEELLVQRALDLGLARDDRLAKRNLIQAVVNIAAFPADWEEPSDQTLREFFEAEAALFAPPPRVSVKIAATASDETARKFAAAIAGGAPFLGARQSFSLSADDPPAGVTLGKLADYAGGAVRDAVASADEGDIVGPLSADGKQIFVWLIAREGGETTFEQARDQVAAEWRRRREEETFDAYVDDLKRRARIRRLVDVTEVQ